MFVKKMPKKPFDQPVIDAFDLNITLIPKILQIRQQ